MLSRLRACSGTLWSPSRLLIPRRNASESFVVRRLKSQEEVRQIIIERADSRIWGPGALDHVSFFAADETGFFVGELDGEPISCMSVVKHAENFAFIGNYMVDEPHQSGGYGFLTWKVAMASINQDYNMAADATEDIVPLFQRIGLQPKWWVQCIDLVASQAAFALSQIPSSPDVTIQPASEVDFNDLLEYDTDVHVFPRQSFLEKWISAPNCHALVAVSNDGRVVGYAIVRMTLKKGDGWRIGPLFAKTAGVARNLYQEICNKVAAEDPQGLITADIPYGDLVNPDALNIVKEMSAILTFKCARYYMKGIPSSMPLQKLFAITSLSIGHI